MTIGGHAMLGLIAVLAYLAFVVGGLALDGRRRDSRRLRDRINAYTNH